MSDTEQSSPEPCCGNLIKIAAALAIVLCAGGLAFAFWPADSLGETQTVLGAVGSNGSETNSTAQADKTDPETNAGNAKTETVSEDDRMRAAIVGDWQTDRDAGHRDLTVNADGTAKMGVTITNFTRFLFGSEMDIDIEWQIEDGKLHFKMVGGTPAKSVEALKKAYGDSLAYPILELTDNRMLVKDGDGDPDHDWKRVVK